MNELRKRPIERITGVIWGLIITGTSIAAMYALSGHPVDMTNVTIVALIVLGAWLIISAFISIRPHRPQPDAVVTEDDQPTEASGIESL